MHTYFPYLICSDNELEIINLATPLTNIELARRVTQHLAQEGHCCLTKITSLTAPQAFDLLGIK